MNLTLFEALEEIGADFGMGGGENLGMDIDIQFMYSDATLPGVTVAAVFTIVGDFSPDLLGAAQEWLEDGHVQMYGMKQEDAARAVSDLTSPVLPDLIKGDTGQCLGTSKDDRVWSFLAHTCIDGTHQVWAAMGAQQLDLEKIKEMAQKFAITHELKQVKQTLH